MKNEMQPNNNPDSRMADDIRKMNMVVSELDPKDVNIILEEFKRLLEDYIPSLKDKIYLESQPEALAQPDGQKAVDKLLDELKKALDDFDDLKGYLRDGNIAAIKEYSWKRKGEIVRPGESRSGDWKGTNAKKIGENIKKLSLADLEKRLEEILKNQRPELN